MTFHESYYQQCTKGFSYYKNHYAKVTKISSQNKSFLAYNWILLTSPTARYKIILLYFTTFSSNKNLFLSALRALRNKFNYDSCKTFILAFDYYHLRIIIIILCLAKHFQLWDIWRRLQLSKFKLHLNHYFHLHLCPSIFRPSVSHTSAFHPINSSRGPNSVSPWRSWT